MEDHVIFCDAPEEVAEAAAELIFEKQTEAVAERGVFRIALSGGRTPDALYRLLASEPYRDEMSWEHWEVYWGDERAVPHDHPESNYRLAHSALLRKVPVTKVFPMFAREDFPLTRQSAESGAGGTEVALADAASSYAQLLEHQFKETPPVFDVILLGIGPDGHTASLFPQEAQPPTVGPESALVKSVAVEHAIPHRLTFTYRVLNSARTVIFLITGEDKAEAVQKILGLGDPSLPATHVKPAGDCYWLVDEAAAHRLE